MSDPEVKISEPFAAISTDCDFQSDATNRPGTKTTWQDDPDKSQGPAFRHGLEVTKLL